MAIEGPLKELSIQDVLQLLELARKTGVLEVRSELKNDRASVHFERGAIVYATRQRSARKLGQHLLRAGKLTERELERALEIQRQDATQRLGRILLEMGSVGEEELTRHLRFQLEETIYELMGWDEGHFRFEERPEVPGSDIAIRVRVESLLMEGARRIDEWVRLEPKIPSTEAVPVLAPAADADAAPLDLHPEEWEVLAEIDGERDLRQIAADLGRASFDVAKIVYGLVSMGVVEVNEAAARIPGQELTAAIAEAEALLDAGDVDGAERLSADLQSAEPDNSEVALLAGRALEAQGRMRAATEAFARVAKLDPLSEEAHFRLGFAAARIGDLDRAAGAWEAFLRLQPNGGRGELVADALDAARALNRILKETS